MAITKPDRDQSRNSTVQLLQPHVPAPCRDNPTIKVLMHIADAFLVTDIPGDKGPPRMCDQSTHLDRQPIRAGLIRIQTLHPHCCTDFAVGSLERTCIGIRPADDPAIMVNYRLFAFPQLAQLL